jgi:putative FmdB family regulatory protein
MPTYEYECGNCGHRFEKFSRITEASVAKCPQCHGPAERLISGGAGLLFKGSGFYITDYRSDSYKKAESKEKGGTGSASSSSDKPAAADKSKDKAKGKDEALKKG